MAGPAAGLALVGTIKFIADQAIQTVGLIIDRLFEVVRRLLDVNRWFSYTSKVLGALSGQLQQMGGVFTAFGESIDTAISSMELMLGYVNDILDLYGPLKYFMIDWAAQMVALAGATGLFVGAMRTIVTEGLHLNAEMEATKITIAALINQYKDLYKTEADLAKGREYSIGYYKELTDSQVANLNEQERIIYQQEVEAQMSTKLTAALKQAAAAHYELTRAAAESPYTTQQLLQGFQAVFAVLGKYNISSFKAAELTAKFARVATVAGVSTGNIASQLRLWLQGIGRITSPLSAFMTGIGLSREYMRKWNADLKANKDNLEKTGSLIAQLEVRLAGFTVAGIEMAASWNGLFSNLMELFQLFTAYVTKDLFESVKKFFFETYTNYDKPLKDLQGNIKKAQDGTIQYAKSARGVLATLFNFGNDPVTNALRLGTDSGEGYIDMFGKALKAGMPRIRGFFNVIADDLFGVIDKEGKRVGGVIGGVVEWISKLMEYLGTEDGGRALAEIYRSAKMVLVAIKAVLGAMLGFGKVDLSTPQAALAAVAEFLKTIAKLILQNAISSLEWSKNLQRVAWLWGLLKPGGLGAALQGENESIDDAGKKIAEYDAQITELRKTLADLDKIKLPKISLATDKDVQQFIEAIRDIIEGTDDAAKKTGAATKIALLDLNLVLSESRDLLNSFFDFQAAKIQSNLRIANLYYDTLKKNIQLEAEAGIITNLQEYLATSQITLNRLEAEKKSNLDVAKIIKDKHQASLKYSQAEQAEAIANYRTALQRAAQESDAVSRANAVRQATQDFLIKGQVSILDMAKLQLELEQEAVTAVENAAATQAGINQTLLERVLIVKKLREEERKAEMDILRKASEEGIAIDRSQLGALGGVSFAEQGVLSENRAALMQANARLLSTSQATVKAFEEFRKAYRDETGMTGTLEQLNSVLEQIRRGTINAADVGYGTQAEMVNLFREEFRQRVEIKRVLEELVKLEAARAKAGELRNQMSLKELEFARAEEDIQRRLTLGAISERDAMLERSAAATVYQNQTREYVQGLLDLAAEVGNPAFTAEVTKIYEEWRRLGEVVNETRQVLTQSFRDGFTTLFTDLMKNMNDARNALRNFISSIISNFQRLIAQRLSDRLFKSLFGSGSIFGKLGEYLGLEEKVELPTLTANAPKGGGLNVATGVRIVGEDSLGDASEALNTARSRAAAAGFPLEQLPAVLQQQQVTATEGLKKSVEAFMGTFEKDEFIAKFADSLGASVTKEFTSKLAEPTNALADAFNKHLPDFVTAANTLSDLLKWATERSPVRESLPEGAVPTVDARSGMVLGGGTRAGEILSKVGVRITPQGEVLIFLPATTETALPFPTEANPLMSPDAPSLIQQRPRVVTEGAGAIPSVNLPLPTTAGRERITAGTGQGATVGGAPLVGAFDLSPVVVAVEALKASFETFTGGKFDSIFVNEGGPLQTIKNAVSSLWTAFDARDKADFTGIKGVLDTIAANTNLASAVSDLTGAASELGGAAGGEVMAASGGYISGAGGPRDDLIPAWLSNGEYVINAAAVKKLGVPFLKMVNSADKIKGHFLGSLISNLGGVFSNVFSGIKGFFGSIGSALGVQGAGGAGAKKSGFNPRMMMTGLIPAILSMLPIKNKLLKRLMPFLGVILMHAFDGKPAAGNKNGGLIQAFANGGAVRTKGGLPAFADGGIASLFGLVGNPSSVFNNPRAGLSMSGSTGTAGGGTSFFKTKLGGTLLSVGLAVGMMLLSRLFAPKGDDTDLERTPDPYGWNPDTLTFYKRPIITGPRRNLASSKVPSKKEQAELRALDELRAKAKIPQKFALGGLVSPTSLVGDVPITGGSQIRLPEVLDALQRRLPEEVMNVNQNISISTPDIHSFKASQASVQRDLGRMAQSGLRRPRRRY